jgi:hypothetical protein
MTATMSTGLTPLVAYLSQPPWPGARFFAADEAETVEALWQSAPAVPSPLDGPCAVLGGVARARCFWVPADPDVLLRDPAAGAARVLRAAEWIVEWAAPDWLVAGSLTTSLTRGGADLARLADERGWRTRITTGDAGTVAVLDALLGDLLVSPADTTVAIVGLGVVGSGILVRLLARGCRVVCIGTDTSRLGRRLAELGLAGDPRILASTDLVDVKRAEVVITLTSATHAVLRPWMLGDPTVILDPAIPPNVDDDPGWCTGGHVVYTGVCQLTAPGHGIPGWRAGCLADDEWYSCLLEGAMHAVLDALWPGGPRSHCVGPVDPEVSRRFDVFRRAVGWGEHAPTRSFGVPLPLEAGREVLRRRLLVAR